jgi:hypothetical protein
MTNISLDFNKLLGFKVTLRALQAMQDEAGRPANAASGEDGVLDSCSAVLRSRIGVKVPTGLRYRRTN